MKKILILLIFLISANLSNAQYIPIPMEYKVENSNLIVEGEVISHNSYLGSDNEIYTENIISIKNVFKGELNTNLVAIITMGGIVDDLSVTWTHLPTLSIGDFGTFFLRSSNRPTYKFDTNVFCIFSGDQGVYLYKKAERKIKVHSILEDYSSLNQFYEAVELNSMHEENLRILETENCLNFEIKLGSNSSELRNTINFDLLIYTDSDSYVLNQAESFVGYSSDWFTQNIISNGLLTFQPEISVDSDYDFSVSDFSTNTLHLSLQKNISDNYLTVSSTPTKIASFTIDIASISSEDPFWEEDRTSTNTYIDDGNIENFPCNNFSFETANCDIIINSLSPTIVAAGVGEWSENDPKISGTVTIYGDNFLTDHGTIEWDCNRPIGHYVQFETIDGNWISPLEGDYLYYTDDSIKVKVPTVGYQSINDNKNKKKLYTQGDINDAVACTGSVKVCKPGNNFGWNCGCHAEKEGLYVKFAARNHIVQDFKNNGCSRSEKLAIQNMDGCGGYTWRMSDEFKNMTNAADIFKRALKTWRCSTQINFSLDPNNSSLLEQNGQSYIGLKALGAGTGVVTKASTSLKLTKCPNIVESGYVKWQAIYINSDFNWHTGTSKPTNLNWNTTGDLESTIVHELGHALLLLHTKNSPNNMMRPSTPQFKRTLHDDDLKGGIHEAILGSNRDWCENNMQLVSSSSCNDVISNCIVSVKNNHKKYQIRTFPNPTSGKVKINFYASQINGIIFVHNIYGQEVLKKNITEDNTIINLGSMPPSTYIVTFKQKGVSPLVNIGKIIKY